MASVFYGLDGLTKTDSMELEELNLTKPWLRYKLKKDLFHKYF